MSQWSSAKAKRVLAALLRIGWSIKRESSSHKILSRPGWPDMVFAFHDKDENSSVGRNFLTAFASKNFVRRLAVGAITTTIAFALGTACAAIWISRRPTLISTSPSSLDCAPLYDAAVVAERTSEDDDPQLFVAFQEPPLYAMPDCVDEAYSLTWIPAFHPPVLVRVWRSGDRAFMVAKELDSKGWSKFGNLKDIQARPLTKFEWRDFSDLLNRASYWQLPSTSNEVLSEDGAAWVVDGLRANKQYHWVRRRVPSEQYAEICKHLIRLSGLETAHALYLP